jgi:hypothetical protein
MLGTVNLDANGSATFTASNLAIGTRAITAVYSGDANFGSVASASLAQAVNTVNPNAPATLTAPTGKAFALMVKFVNSAGAVDTGFNGKVTVHLKSGPGSLGGTLTVNAVGGVATFKNLTLSKLGKYSLTVTSPGVATLTVGARAGANKLTAVFSPTPLAAAVTFRATISATDLRNHLDALFSGTVHISAKGPGHLVGKATAKLSKGHARLAGLEFTRPGKYTVTLTAGNVTTKLTVNVGGKGRQVG